MKELKLAIVNFWPGFIFEESPTYLILKNHFKVIIDNGNPDFVISSVFGNINNVLKYSCPRIQYIGQSQSTDFTLFDYSIDFDFLELKDINWKDRHFRLPLGFCEWHNQLSKKISKVPTYKEAEEIWSSKTKFCNFVYGHKSQLGIRERLLEAIEKYKHVDSAGRFNNNMPNGRIVSYAGDKIDFLKDYKFTIACEALTFPGFVTEKIIHAFYADSIPIYLGDPLVDKTYNPESFINVNKYKTLDEVVDRIIEIDNNKELFIKMIRAPKYSVEYEYDKVMKRYEEFLLYIFNQKPEEAYRRQLYYSAEYWENELKKRFSWQPPKPSLIKRICRKIRRLLHI